jgi:hypothetical protein
MALVAPVASGLADRPSHEGASLLVEHSQPGISPAQASMTNAV